jgi:hypothetical protein
MLPNELSAHAQLRGAFDYNRSRLAPPGTCVLDHEKTSIRGTWSPHAVGGWYLGRTTKHYRCYRISAERIADTLALFPTQVAMPTGGVSATLHTAHLATAIEPFPFCANAVIDPLSNTNTKRNGNLPHTTAGTNTMHFISHKALSAGRRATYLCILAKIRPEKAETNRMNQLHRWRQPHPVRMRREHSHRRHHD